MRYRHERDGDSNARVLEWLSLALITAGVALRLWQYAGRSSLWTDEATVVNNIVGRPFAQLAFAPLAHNQAAPVGFVLIEKLAVVSFGANELALRAYPLLCAIISLVLLWRIATRLLPAASVPFALAPFACAPPLIFFAAEAKQYSSDMAIALALLFAALTIGDRDGTAHISTRRLVATAAGGALAVWLSHPAVLVLTGLGAALVIGTVCTRERPPSAPLVWIVTAWMVSALAATLVSVEHLTPESQRFMRMFWSDGFWPLSLRHPASIAWPIVRISYLLGGQLGLPTSIGFVSAALACVGVVASWRREWRTSLFLAMPIAVALGASVLHLYPLAERLALFLIPSLLLLAAIGITEMASLLRLQLAKEGMRAVATLALLVAETQALYAAPPVYRREEIVPAIEYLRRASLATDESYIFYGAAPAYDFYTARYAPLARTTMGGCHRGDPSAYVAEVDRLRGHSRVWLLFAHELPVLGEREAMLRHLADIGVARDSMVTHGRDTDGHTTSVRLYLYDLSDSGRPSVAHPYVAALQNSMALVERLRCAPVSE
jgi:hypothetical protein